MIEKLYNLIFENPDARRENANVNADTQNGALFLLGTEAGKALALQKLLPADMADAHTSGDIHIHDLPFYGISFNCIQHDLCKLFSKIFKIDTCSIRPPQSVESMGALLAIVLQTAQGESFGGQGVPDYDFVMAEGVRKTFRREFELELNRLPLASDIQELRNKAWDAAWRNTERRTFQAAEALVHNLNSLRARAGGQLTFSNLNYGLDTSAEGRMATRCLLKTTMEGLGDRATPIFPVQMFLVKEGVNYNPGDPNYDLFQLAMECSAKRMWPNFIFLDAPFNKDKEVRMFGCRTRVVANIFDPAKEIAPGRGNLFFTTINLPRLGLKATSGGATLGHGDIPLFFDLLDDVMDLGIRQLHHRFNILAHKKVRNFPFLFGEGIWLGSETLDPDDEIGDVWKHGTLSLGFIGLAETLVALIGKHHGESDEAQKLGLEIVGYMRKRLDLEACRRQMNFTLLATPAEGCCQRLVNLDQARYGALPGVTDKEYYSNSFHVPVDFTISAFDKIALEAPYHALTNAGHITYVELDGDPSKNLVAFESIVRAMHDAGIGYGAINHPLDFDPVCGFSGVIDNECPKCGREADEKVQRLRRIVGYLAPVNRWNAGKLAELKDRKLHCPRQASQEKNKKCLCEG